MVHLLQGTDLSTKEAQFIQTKIKENPVMLFSKTTCSFCKMAKKVLSDVGVNYEVEELDTRDDTESMQDMLLKWTGTRTVRYQVQFEIIKLCFFFIKIIDSLIIIFNEIQILCVSSNCEVSNLLDMKKAKMT